MGATLPVSNAELRSARETMQKLTRMLDELDAGDVPKYVVTQNNRMRAVLLTVDEYARLRERANAADGPPPPDAAASP